MLANYFSQDITDETVEKAADILAANSKYLNQLALRAGRTEKDLKNPTSAKEKQLARALALEKLGLNLDQVKENHEDFFKCLFDCTNGKGGSTVQVLVMQYDMDPQEYPESSRRQRVIAAILRVSRATNPLISRLLLIIRNRNFLVLTSTNPKPTKARKVTKSSLGDARKRCLPGETARMVQLLLPRARPLEPRRRLPPLKAPLKDLTSSTMLRTQSMTSTVFLSTTSRSLLAPPCRSPESDNDTRPQDCPLPQPPTTVP